jgi:hypothetical protein
MIKYDLVRVWAEDQPDGRITVLITDITPPLVLMRSSARPYFVVGLGVVKVHAGFESNDVALDRFDLRGGMRQVHPTSAP